MARKLLILCFLLVSTFMFSQKTIEKVYAAPNPFVNTTKIYIDSKNQQTVFFTVKNILGTTVHSEKVSLLKGKNSISFSKNKLRSGVYMYSIQNKKEIISKRIIIQ